MAKLYEINSQIENFEFEIDDFTGEILNAGELEGLEVERDAKIESLALWYKNMMSMPSSMRKKKSCLQRERELRTTKRKVLSVSSSDILMVISLKLQRSRYHCASQRSLTLHQERQYLKTLQR